MGCHCLLQHCFPSRSHIQQPEDLQTLYFEDFYGSFISHVWWILNSISCLCPLSGESEEWLIPLIGKFQASLHNLVFLVISPLLGTIQEPNQSHLFRTRHSYHPGNSKGFRNFVAGTRTKDQILAKKKKKKMLLVLSSLRKSQGF